jgi:hypothetical protein
MSTSARPLLSTVGVLAALMDRQKTGKGQKVETALLRTAINIANPHLIEQSVLNLNRIATLNRGFTAGPSDTFKCKDGWIYAMTIGQPLFVRWCRLMGNEDLAADPRFKDDLARGDNGEALSAIMQKWCDGPHRRRGARAARGQPHSGGAVYTPQQALDDRHVNEAGFFHRHGVPRHGQAGAGAAGAGEAVAHAADHPPPRAPAGRAYRRHPGLSWATTPRRSRSCAPTGSYDGCRPFRRPARPCSPADADLLRRGRWLTDDCRVDVGDEPFFLSIRDGSAGVVRAWRAPDALDSLCRPRHRRGLDQPLEAAARPGWHDLFALTKRGAAAMEGDLRPLLQNPAVLQGPPRRYPKDFNNSEGYRRDLLSGRSATSARCRC